MTNRKFFFGNILTNAAFSAALFSGTVLPFFFFFYRKRSLFTASVGDGM